MRKRELRLVITFNTTADAMAMEAACKKEEMPGRLIPVPSVISAGCGLAWSTDESFRGDFEVFTERNGLSFSDMVSCVV
ncbi:MAG: DUF3343 domain-containing protein [Clostridia bacterium]|nr:DUF3343 domain-containing protein [Clostridia bacterium]